MLEIGKTRYGTPIVMRWRVGKNGELIPQYQVFMNDAELFDAEAVYTLVAARQPHHQRESEIGQMIRRNAIHFEEWLLAKKNAESLASELRIYDAFDRARYAETLVNVCFK